MQALYTCQLLMLIFLGNTAGKLFLRNDGIIIIRIGGVSYI